MESSTVIAGIGLLGSIVAVWVQLNERVVRLETKADHVEKQYDQIALQLARIEAKLDGKQDRPHN
jgi:hypothetical protein